jgi:hypothetical protein
MSLFHFLGCTKGQSKSEACELFRNMVIFYGEELLAPRPNPKLEDRLSAVRDCLFNIFASAVYIGDLSSIRNLKTSHAL